jgi:hypothetical protein
METPQPNPSHNPSFSLSIPQFQFAIDSTSLGTFKECPRKYELSIIHGYQSREPSVHLVFGIYAHKIQEVYSARRALGEPHEDALRITIRMLMMATWDQALGRGWISGSATKNRFTLIQSAVWYLDQFGQNDAFQTLVLDNGKPAVELSFRIDLGRPGPDGQSILYCGHIDRVAMGPDGSPWILDTKTTERPMDHRWCSQWHLSLQFRGYLFAGKTMFSIPASGIIVDGMQVLQSGTRFTRYPVPIANSQLEEFLQDLHLAIDQMEIYAKHQYWPQNEKACQNYGGCGFFSVCSKPKESRQLWLESNFIRRQWNPLQTRET